LKMIKIMSTAIFILGSLVSLPAISTVVGPEPTPISVEETYLGKYMNDIKDDKALVSIITSRVGDSYYEYNLREFTLSSGDYSDVIFSGSVSGTGWLHIAAMGALATYGSEGGYYIQLGDDQKTIMHQYGDVTVNLPVNGILLAEDSGNVIVDTIGSIQLVENIGSVDEPIFVSSEIVSSDNYVSGYPLSDIKLINGKVYFSELINGNPSLSYFDISTKVKVVLSIMESISEFSVDDSDKFLYTVEKVLDERFDLVEYDLSSYEKRILKENIVEFSSDKSFKLNYQFEKLYITEQNELGFLTSIYNVRSSDVLKIPGFPRSQTDDSEFQLGFTSYFPFVNEGEYLYMNKASTGIDVVEYHDINIIAYELTNDDNVVEIKTSAVDLVVDPYNNPSSQFTIDVSGSEVYGLDVSCNLSSTALSVTQASYDGLFGSQNSMTLPLIYDASSVTGIETLVAPELPFTGDGSFVLADVIAEFTTKDVDITCAAEVSDENGQLMQVTLTPATIRIDDGVHGGSGSISGVIEIPGVEDLSGVEVILTIDGRQVTVVTDENGRFEFEGLRDGDFTISLASENYVQSCQAANVAEGAAVDLGSIELLAGDINADGNIDIADFTYMAARYRSNQGDSDYDAKADLNKDGTINIQDLAILGSHFGSTQCNL
jgi:hypothetical protein